MHTFVICAYKESSFLEECILSCLNQTSLKKGKSKLILYTSTPNTYITEIANSYEIPMFTSSGGSIGRDWNNALSFVDTPYATIVHQDDIYLKEYGESVIDAFENNNQTSIVFTDYKEIDQESQIRKRSINLKIKTFGLKTMGLLQ